MTTRFIVFIIGLCITILSLGSIFSTFLFTAGAFPTAPITDVTLTVAADTPILAPSSTPIPTITPETQATNIATSEPEATVKDEVEAVQTPTSTPESYQPATHIDSNIVSIQDQQLANTVEYSLKPLPYSEPVYYSRLDVTFLGVHSVKHGESFYCIAEAYNVSPFELARFNNRNPRAYLPVDVALRIPDLGDSSIHSSNVCGPQFTNVFSESADAMITTTPSPTISTTATVSTPTPTITTTTLAKISNTVVFTLTETEPRQIEVRRPKEMRIGESLFVEIVFFPDSADDDSGSESSTPNTDEQEEIEQGNYSAFQSPFNAYYYENQRLFASANLVGPGFEISPIYVERQEIIKTETNRWMWSVKPLDMENQTLIGTIKLDYDSKDSPRINYDREIVWTAPIHIRVRGIFGIRSSYFGGLDFAGAVVGLFMTTGSGLQEMLERRRKRINENGESEE